MTDNNKLPEQHVVTQADREAIPADVRLRFMVALRQIEDNVYISGLTDAEIDALIAAAQPASPSSGAAIPAGEPKSLGAYVGITSASNSKHPNAADVAGGSLNWPPQRMYKPDDAQWCYCTHGGRYMPTGGCPMCNTSGFIQPTTPTEGQREVIARTVFAKLNPHDSWEDFDTRFEDRGRVHHPMQLQAFGVADAILASLSSSVVPMGEIDTSDPAVEAVYAAGKKIGRCEAFEEAVRIAEMHDIRGTAAGIRKHAGIEPTPTASSDTALREALDDAIATLMAVRATASDLDEWAGSADHFSDLCAREIRKLQAALNPDTGKALSDGEGKR